MPLSCIDIIGTENMLPRLANIERRAVLGVVKLKCPRRTFVKITFFPQMNLGSVK